MLGSALADTGGLLALLDRNDRWHAACTAAFAELRLPLVTSAAVLTELFHLLHRSRVETAAAWRFVRSGAVRVAPIDDADMPALEALMIKYADLPMDFADATLVRLAQREAIATVLTVDASDFAVYRVDRRKRLRVVPGGAR